MRRPKIIEGRPFDWEAGKEAMNHVVDSEGNVNYRAAMCADPGVVKCPNCNAYYWREGTKIECLECGMVFELYNFRVV